MKIRENYKLIEILYKIWNDTSTPYKEALFVSKKTKEEHDRYANGLVKVFQECKRVLKSDGLMVFTYHHKDIKAWISLATALIENSFEVTNIFPVRSEGRSGFHSTSGSIKWDSVFCCRSMELGKKKVIKDSYFIKWINTHLHRWKKRLDEASIEFNEADEKSFIFSLAVARLTEYPASTENMITLLSELDLRSFGENNS